MKTYVAAAILGLGMTLLACAASATTYQYVTVAETSDTGALLAFDSFDVPSLNDSGAVVFDGIYNCTKQDQCQGLWMVPAGGAPMRVASGAIPNKYPSFSFSGPEINDAGTISASVLIESGTPPNGGAIYAGAIGAFKRISPIATSTTYGNPQILDSGGAVYSTGGHDFVAHGGKVTVIAPKFCFTGTDSSPSGNVASVAGPLVNGECSGTTGIFTTNITTKVTKQRVKANGNYGQLAGTTVNDGNTLIFAGRGLPHRNGNVNGLFTQTPTGATTLLATIDNGSCTGPGNDCQWLYYNSLAVNASGMVAASVNGTAANGGPFYGVALNGDIVNGQVAWPGMTINDCPVVQASSGQRAINSTGQIVFMAYCSTGELAVDNWFEIILATPQT